MNDPDFKDYQFNVAYPRPDVYGPPSKPVYDTAMNKHLIKVHLGL